MYLIYILDTPQMGHEVKHSPLQYRKCAKPNLSTFVDDNYVKVRKNENETMEQCVYKTMKMVKGYMDSNQLAINSDKSKIMIITKKKELKENFEVILDGKLIKHSAAVKFLGTTMDENLTWDRHLENELIPNLKNRIRTLRMTTKYMSAEFKKQYTSAIFRGKLLFGMETWGGTKQAHVTALQKLQDQAAKLALQGITNSDKLSSLQRHNKLNWLPVKEEIIFSYPQDGTQSNKLQITSRTVWTDAFKQICPKDGSPQKTCSKTKEFMQEHGNLKHI